MFEKINNQLAVLKHKCWVFFYMSKICWHLFIRALRHDLSKMGKYEEPYFRKYTNRLSGSNYGSKEYYGHMYSLSSGVKHHYKHNSHHPEYHEDGFNNMSFLDILEMLADWRSACRRNKNGSMANSFEINQERFGITDQQKSQLIKTAKELGLMK